MIVTFGKNDSGEYFVDYHFSLLYPRRELIEVGPERYEWIEEWDFEGWRQQLLDTRITVTADDLKNAGCDSLEGEEFENALARCFAEKVAEFYTSLDDTCPALCREARVFEIKPTGDSRYIIKLAMLPANIYTFLEELDYPGFCDANENPELMGWLLYAGKLRAEFTLTADGDYVCSPLLGD